jgi:nucleoside-diphosphate-sugar epimerase
VTKDQNLVLVTGSAGFIGSALMRRLEVEGIPAIGLRPGTDLADWEHVKHLADSDVKNLTGLVLKNVTGFDVVVHLASRVQVSLSYEDPRNFLRDNFLSTLHALELARRNSARFVLAGSYVYGIPQYLPVDERHPTSAISPYMASKLMAEDLCATYHRDFGVPVVILRTFNAIGPRQRGYFLFPKILEGLAVGRISLGDPEARRDFVYIDDVVEAFVAALAWRGSAFEVFNIGSGSSVAVAAVVDKVIRLSGRAAKVEYERHARPSEIPNTVADIRKAAQLLKWKPKIPFETAIRRMLEAQENG